MALQGTIDVVPITDVLGLISAAKMSGRLLVEGDRGSKTLWVLGGDLVGFDQVGDDHVTAVAGLMRHSEATFLFEPSDEPSPVVGIAAEPLQRCIDQATEVVERWSHIERTVPSMDHRVFINSTIGEAVTIEPAAWAIIGELGDGPSLTELGARTGFDEYTLAVTVVDLVQRGLTRVGEPDVAGDAFPTHFPLDDAVADDPFETGAWGSSEPGAAMAMHHSAAPTAPAALAVDSADRADWLDEVASPVNSTVTSPVDATDEVLRQMARLSPEAADAIAAALDTSSEPNGSFSSAAPDTAFGVDAEGQTGTADADPADPSASISYLQSF